jgi:cell division protein FtsA
MNTNKELIMGLDIGSTKICAAICIINKAGELSLVSVGTSISAGLKKGRIENAEELCDAIKKAVQKAEHKAGIRPDRVLINLPLYGVEFAHNLGFILSKEETGQISKNEKNECIKRSGNIYKTSKQKILHVIPLFFKVDGTVVKNPVGVFGSNLEVQTHMILGRTSAIMGISNILKNLDLHISGIIYDPIAVSQIMLTDAERREGGVLVDIGGQFTKVSIFRDNLLHRSFFIPVGGTTLTQDIATCLKTTIPEAERIKILHTNVNLEDVMPKEKIEILPQNSKQVEIDKLLLCQIAEARIAELVELIKTELDVKLDSSYTCVLAGCSSQIAGLRSYFQKKLEIHCRQGIPEDVTPIVEDIGIASAVGLIIYGIKTGAIPYQSKPKNKIAAAVSGWAKKLF